MPDATRPVHAPADHPAIANAKTGVLLANLGTPDHYSYWPMRRYLGEFLSDRRVIDYSPWKWQPLLQLVILSKRPFTSGKAYKSIWNEEKGESPLMTITRDQTAKLSKALTERYGDQVMVDFCMRYGNPSTRSKVRALVEAGCTRILFFPLYPQYAGATSATANDQFFRALMEETWQPTARVVEPYFEHPRYIEALATSVERAYGELTSKPEILVVSYHGMPRRYLLQGDPYHCQCQKTTRLLRERLGWDETQITTTFQSVFGPEEWLRPIYGGRGGPVGPRRGQETHRGDRPPRSRPIASRRWKRSTKKSVKASRTRGASRLPIFRASTMTRRISGH